ncbi:MAG: IgGFc-binding protein [Ignavibacteriae bacterium]|nr:IgGFc-binding protein [Ignavibacteriota bacterium]MCB9215872.1 IgGFc-binding protein [Ignavibacteria bacterium]
MIIKTLRSYIFLSLLLLFSLSTLLVESGQAQTRNRSDHRGKEFRLAFLHTNGDGTFPTYYIVVSSEIPTRGTITYEATGETYNIAIPFANNPERIKLDTFKLLLPDPAGGTEISHQTLTVRFQDEVTLYAINTLRWSSDSYLPLPIDALGLEHTIMAYPSTAEPGPTGQIFETSDFPSQFAVIATENNTSVTIQPTVSVNGRGNTNQYVVKLNAGEVYFGQARDRGRSQRAGRDLTGSVVIADKPVVVYGSHQRSNIPWNEAVGRDHLVEQMPSVDRWGYHAMVTPHFQLEKTVDDANFIRVIASQPGTLLTIDSGASQGIPVGRPIEIPLQRAMLLTANKPISVAQFQHSTVDVEFISLPNDTVGDPFMMLVPPREQFDSNYSFESWDTKDFLYHFINVVIPTERISSLRLDGRPVAAQFIPIPKTSYSYAQIPMTAGGHNISARVPFGLYIYGYGPYNSYGAPGGMVFDSLFTDHEPPDIRWRDTCNGVVGAAFDTTAFDFGMEDLRLLSGSRNVRLENQQFVPGVDSIQFRLELVDPYQDGHANLLAVDTAGLQRRYEFDVKGFTVALTGGAPPVQLDTLASLNGIEFCKTITLRNYGTFPQEIKGIDFKDQMLGLQVRDTFPFTLQPGEARNVLICFQHVGDTSALVEIRIDNGCQIRPVALLPLLSGIDSLTPAITLLSSECDDNVVFDIAESYAQNSGIAFITLNTVVNAEVLTPETLPSKRAKVEIRRKSIWKDVIYDIEVVDVVGNRIRLNDTIGGLTLAITDQSSVDEFGFKLEPAIPWEYERLVYTRNDCDTLWLENTGLKPLDLRRLRFIGNLEFSVPPDQLPLRLKPNERKAIEVCVKPNAAGDFRDTMIIEFFCGRLINVVEFKSVVDPLSGHGADRCGNQMEFNVMGFTKQNFLENPIPNPSVKGTALLTFGLKEPETLTITLHDALGNEMRRFLDSDPMPGGIGQIRAELDGLSSGGYYLRMETSSGEVFLRPLIIQQ